MQKLKQGIARHKHVKLLNLVNPDLKHRNILARKFYKKGKKLYYIADKKSILNLYSSMLVQRSSLKSQYSAKDAKTLPELRSSRLLQKLYFAKRNFVTYKQNSEKVVMRQTCQPFNFHNALFMLMYKKGGWKDENAFGELTTLTQKRRASLIKGSTLLSGPFAKTLLFCQNKAPMSVLYAESRQYITKKYKQRVTLQSSVTDLYKDREQNKDKFQVESWNKTRSEIKFSKVGIKLLQNNSYKAPLLDSFTRSSLLFPRRSHLLKNILEKSYKLPNKTDAFVQQSSGKERIKPMLLLLQDRSSIPASFQRSEAPSRNSGATDSETPSVELKRKTTYFYQLTHTQKLEVLYPTNLDKMSFLSLDLANLALSLSTYTFLKSKKIDKVGNLLEYSPKNLYLFLDKNREMFVELKTCLLLLGFWQKKFLV